MLHWYIIWFCPNKHTQTPLYERWVQSYASLLALRAAHSSLWGTRVGPGADLMSKCGTLWWIASLLCCQALRVCWEIAAAGTTQLIAKPAALLMINQPDWLWQICLLIEKRKIDYSTAWGSGKGGQGQTNETWMNERGQSILTEERMANISLQHKHTDIYTAAGLWASMLKRVHNLCAKHLISGFKNRLRSLDGVNMCVYVFGSCFDQRVWHRGRL